METPTVAQGQEVIHVSIKEVLNMMRQGKTRNEIAKHFNLTPSERKELFNHPQLKGKKVMSTRPSRLQIHDESTSEEDTDSTEHEA